MDLVSIVIPVFNTGEPFRSCMESVLNQTYSNLEVVVVDDHSTDPLTLNLMQEFAQKDSRIKLVVNEVNRGLAASRNVGIDHSSGGYATFLDSDDLFVPDYIEKAHQAIVQNRTDFVVCNIKNFTDDDSIPLEPDFVFNLSETGVIQTKNFLLDGKLMGIPITACAKLFNLPKYRSANLSFREEMRFAEDQDWSYRLFCGMSSFTVLNFFAIRRLLRMNSMLHASKERDLIQDLHSQYLKAEVLKQHGYFELYKDMFFDQCCGVLIHVLQRTDNAETKRKLPQIAAQEFEKIGYFINPQPSNLVCFVCWLKYKLSKTFHLKRSKIVNKALYKTYSQILKG